MSDGNTLSQEEINALLNAVQDENAIEAADTPDNVTGPSTANDGPMNQDEVDALLKSTQGYIDINDDMQGSVEELAPDEKDALGEIGNISMGSASTTLSELLNQKVVITSPRVYTISQRELFESFTIPYMVIHVQFTQGLTGFNVLIMKLHDAMIMADLMMGGNGKPESSEISEIEISAASEAMNQMIGTASTSLSTMFRRTVNISPPITTLLNKDKTETSYSLPAEDTVVVVSFRMSIGDLVDTELMQIMSLATAREEAKLLLNDVMPSSAPRETAPETPTPKSGTGPSAPAAPAAAQVQQQVSPPQAGTYDYEPSTSYAMEPLTEAEKRKLELLLDIPLNVSVVLGKARRPIKEVLGLTPGAIVELNSLVDEPVEVYVNGTLVARGEVVVVNENFGVKINSIISPRERVQNLKVAQ